MNYKFIIALTLFSLCRAASASTWVEIETTTAATLRVATPIPSGSSYNESVYLKSSVDLPAGTRLKYVPANTTTKKYLYNTSSGSLTYSQFGWVRTIVIHSIPGNPLTSTGLANLNRAPLFISETLANTFKRIDGGDQGGVLPPSGAYNTASCLEPLVQKGVPRTPLVNLFNFYNSNQSSIDEKRYLALSDYSSSSRRERFYMIDLATCGVEKEIVAHGSGSFSYNGVKKPWGDPDHDSMLDRCIYGGNRQNMTRPGFALIKGYHYSSQSWPVVASNGAKGLKLYELGRAKDEKFNLAARGVVMHEQYYVASSTPGRSYGCPAMKPGKLKPKVSILKQGVLYYAYAPQCGNY